MTSFIYVVPFVVVGRKTTIDIEVRLRGSKDQDLKVFQFDSCEMRYNPDDAKYRRFTPGGPGFARAHVMIDALDHLIAYLRSLSADSEFGPLVTRHYNRYMRSGESLISYYRESCVHDMDFTGEALDLLQCMALVGNTDPRFDRW